MPDITGLVVHILQEETAGATASFSYEELFKSFQMLAVAGAHEQLRRVGACELKGYLALTHDDTCIAEPVRATA
jgi:hypothetical protein